MAQKDDVILAMEKNGGYATFQQLNNLVDVSNWETKTPAASIRKIVQVYDEFFKIKPGLWALTKCKDDVLKKLDIEPNNKKSDELFTHTYYQGIVVEINEYEYLDLDELILLLKDKEYPAIAILDGIEDPHNFGAILRSGDALGIDGYIIASNRQVGLTSTVAKVSTGAIEYVPVCEVTNLNMTISDLKKEGFWVVGLELDGKIDYRKQDYHGKIAVVIGSEGRGISKLVKENCDFLVRIPMYGKVNSLNASVSAGLLLYQILTNRGM